MENNDLFRIKHTDFEQIFNTDSFDTMHSDEWVGEATNVGINRLKEKGWEERYEYEAALICGLIEQNPHIKNVLEL